MSHNNSVEQLYAAAARIRDLHDTQGLSYRDIARSGEFGDVSHTTLRDVANGHEPSAATCRAMGIKKSRHYVVAFHLDNPDDAERLRRLFKAHGETYREIAGKLLSGELELRG